VKSLMWVVVAGALVGGTGFVDRAEAGDQGRERQARQAGGNVRTAVPRQDERRDRDDLRNRDDRRDDWRDHDGRRDRDRRDYVRDVRRDHYFGSRDVVVIRNYYRPYYRPLPRNTRYVYARSGYMPYGWAKRIQPIPVYVERTLPPVPYGYRRGLIDGYAVVYNPSGFILDVALLF
jgi:hypothetical protein